MDFSSLPVLLISTIICSAIVLFFFKHLCSTPKKAASSGASGASVIKPYPILGNVHHFVKNRHRFQDWVTEILTASPTGTVTVAPVVFTVDPAAVEHIARSHFSSYQKGNTVTTALHDFLGNGIFNSNGDTWRLQRKTASFEFNTRSLRSFIHQTIRCELDDRLLPLLTNAAQTGSVLDLQDVLERFAFDNICSLVFDSDPAVLGGSRTEDGERFYHAFEEATHLSIQRWTYPFHWMWKLMRWLNAGSERQLRASLAIVRLSVERMMERGHKPTHSDLLSRFAESGELPEDSIHDILVNFVLAGRDTTPSALTWFFWALSSLPRVTDNIVEETKSVRSKNGVFTLEDLRGMQYLHAALTESMRFHPPVPTLPRECIEDDILPDGTLVRKGWTVMYSALAMGRSERVWGKDWEEFRPERWLENGVFKAESSFKYPVFHSGPRVCLGKEMAYIQMKAVAAAVIEKFEVEVVEERGERELSATMRMAGGLPVRLKKRNA